MSDSTNRENELCTDCGRRMVWQRETDYPGSWMCPNCVMRRCDEAEVKVATLTRERDAMRLDVLGMDSLRDKLQMPNAHGLDIATVAWSRISSNYDEWRKSEDYRIADRAALVAAQTVASAAITKVDTRHEVYWTGYHDKDCPGCRADKAFEDAVDAYRASQPQGGSDA